MEILHLHVNMHTRVFPPVLNFIWVARLTSVVISLKQPLAMETCQVKLITGSI